MDQEGHLTCQMGIHQRCEGMGEQEFTYIVIALQELEWANVMGQWNSYEQLRLDTEVIPGEVNGI